MNAINMGMRGMNMLNIIRMMLQVQAITMITAIITRMDIIMGTAGIITSTHPTIVRD